MSIVKIDRYTVKDKNLKNVTHRYIVISCILLASLLALGGCATSPSPVQSAPALSGTPATPRTPSVTRQVLNSRQAATLSPSGGDSRWNIPPGSVLIAVNRVYGSTVGVVMPDNRILMSDSPAASVDNVQASRLGPRLAYIPMPGIDPGDNFIETVDLSSGRTQHVKAAKGFAIFGFALAPDGKLVALSEAALAGTSSQQVSWRLLTADMQSGQVRQVMSSDNAPADMGESVPVPFAWSQTTGDVYLRALRPFRGGGGEGIWAMRPDGSGLRRLLQENEFVGMPLLSADGARFAYLASDLEALPAGLVSSVGEPPGNIVLVMDLKTGQARVVSKEKDRAIGPLAWSRDGGALITSRREWVDDRLRDTAIVAFSVEDSSERQVLSLPQDSNVRNIFDLGIYGLLWVNEGREGSDLMVSRGTGPLASILTIPRGQIKIVGYLN